MLLAAPAVLDKGTATVDEMYRRTKVNTCWKTTKCETNL